MNAATLGYLISFLSSLPQLITASEDVIAWLTTESARIQGMISAGRSPTPEEWAALDLQIASLRTVLNGASPVTSSTANTAVPVTTTDDANAGAAARAVPLIQANEGA